MRGRVCAPHAVRLDDARHEPANAANRCGARDRLKRGGFRASTVRVAVAALARDRGDDVPAYVSLLDKAIERISAPGAARQAFSVALPGFAPLHAARGA
jgi:hypothetical protein